MEEVNETGKQNGRGEAETGVVGRQQIAVHRSRPVEGRLQRVQHGDVHLAGLARLLDEDGAEEEENIEATVL